MDVAESIVNSWTVFEYIRRIKRFDNEDSSWIQMSQDALQESLGQLIGRDKAVKRIANARIALREWQEEQKQLKAKEPKKQEKDTPV